MSLGEFLQSLGIGERRCSHCLAPWFPSGVEVLASSLCPVCQPWFYPWWAPVCSLCGLPVAAGERICASCRRKPPLWSGLRCFGLYEGPLRDVILRLKFDGELHLALLLAELLLQVCACLPKPDLLMPVPQYPAGLRKRGFNQTREICRHLARFSGVAADYRSLRRVRSGAPQETLDAATRRINLQDAFSAGFEVAGCRIWLLDDVVTTGSTCRYATEALLKSGAKEVYILACARAVLA